MDMIASTPEIDDIVAELKRVKEFSKQVKKREDELKQSLYNHMNEHEALVSEDGEVLLTWKYTADVEYFDSKKLKEESPDLYDQYVTTRAGSRRMIINET